MVNVSNQANPVRVGEFDTEDSAVGVAVVGNRVSVADADSGLRVVDFSNPAMPVRLGRCDTAGLTWGVKVSGNYAFIADCGTGLRVIDVNDPLSLVCAEGCATTGLALGVAVLGDYAGVTIEEWGLEIFRLPQGMASARPVWLQPMRLTTNGYEAWLELKVQRDYRVETSTNLVLWQFWLTLSNATGQLLLIDPAAITTPHKVYWAVME